VMTLDKAAKTRYLHTSSNQPLFSVTIHTGSCQQAGKGS